MKFRSIIRNILPYYIVEWNRKKHSENSFIEEFNQSKYNSENEISDELSYFDSIVSVQGFGYSGSGAVIDFLREYPCAEVIGYVDKKEEGGGFVPEKMKMSEIDFIRLSGGLFEIEKYLESDNFFFNDALLNRTANLFGQASLFKYSDRVKNLMFKFFSNITSIHLSNLQQIYYNYHTLSSSSIPDILFLKQMTRSEYVNLCRVFLMSVFNVFAGEGRKFLVCDQLLSDGDLNIKRNIEYIPNLKTIIVIRDPRDTYCWAVKKNVEWIAHNSVEQFIEWYKIMYKNVPLHSSNDFLIVRYENFVLDYDKEEINIQSYMGLKLEDHILRKEYFKPDYSRRFVGIYKEIPELDEDCTRISEELPNYCNPIID